MSLNDLLYEKGCSELQFVEYPHKLRILEIWIYPDSNDRFIIEESLPYDCIEQWLRQKGRYEPPKESKGCKPVGLRLLIQQWQIAHFNPGSRVLPFAKSTLDNVINLLYLPKSYPHDFANGRHLPGRLERVDTLTGKNIGIVLQSPKFIASFMSLALSFDPISNITRGFLGHVTGNGVNGPIDPVLEDLKRMVDYSSHPVLLPALAFGLWCHILRDDCTNINWQLRDIQGRTGLMKDYLRQTNAEENLPLYVDFDKIHSELVEQQQYLSSSISDFVFELGEFCLVALSDIGEVQKMAAKRDTELKAYILQMQRMAKSELQHKDRMLSRVDVQFKVLYSLMQQRDSRINHEIAVETKRDSAAMKSIALLTMVFLPATAVATIFSMSPFFSSNSGLDIVTSSQFWIYWAVTVPLTVMVLIMFLLWLERGRFLKHLARNGRFSPLAKHFIKSTKQT